MTSKSNSYFQISGAYRLVAAVFAIAVLTGCAPDFRNLGPCAVCFGPPTQVSLEGTLSGPRTGALTVVAGSPFAADKQPSSVAVDPTGMFTYVVNSGSDTVSIYAIEATTGALTPINGSVIATGTQPAAIAISD